MNKNYIFSTKRLRFREWDIHDAPFLFELNADPLVLKYTGDPPFSSTEDAEAFIEGYSHYKEYGYGRWICEHKESKTPIGWAGLKNQIDSLGIIDIGYRLKQDYWNQGFGFEAAQGCLKEGFGRLKMERITGRVAMNNAYSHKILENLGLVKEKELKDCHGLPATYYSLSKSEYEKLSS